MDYLEERVRRVFSNRIRILRDIASAEEKGIDVCAVRTCDNLTKEIVQIFLQFGLESAAEHLGIENENISLLYFGLLHRNIPKTRKERIAEIKKAIEQRAKSIEEISIKIGMSPAHIYQKYRKDVSLPGFENQKNRYHSRRNPEIDELIELGVSLCEIAKKQEISRERVRQYILSTGQYNEWKKAREKNIQERETTKFILRKIVSQIKEVAKRRGMEEHALAYEKTEKYFSKVNGEYFCGQIFSFLKDYYETRERGEKISIMKLGGKHGLWCDKAYRILKTIGEKPLVKPPKKTRETIPEYKRQALERAAEMPISNSDIGYFLGLSEEVVSRHYRFSENRDRRANADFHKPLKRFGKAYLAYRLASQIYEAIDSRKQEGCGFSKQETLEVLSCDERVFNYALEHRSEIEPVIIKVLKTAYPDEVVNKPYKNFKC